MSSKEESVENIFLQRKKLPLPSPVCDDDGFKAPTVIQMKQGKNSPVKPKRKIQCDNDESAGISDNRDDCNNEKGDKNKRIPVTARIDSFNALFNDDNSNTSYIKDINQYSCSKLKGQYEPPSWGGVVDDNVANCYDVYSNSHNENDNVGFRNDSNKIFEKNNVKKKWVLEIIRDGSVLEIIKLQFNKEKHFFTIGSLAGSVDILCNNPMVSRMHLVIQHSKKGNIYAFDVFSTHGTRINHTCIPSGQFIELKKNDQIVLGPPSHSRWVYVLSEDGTHNNYYTEGKKISKNSNIDKYPGSEDALILEKGKDDKNSDNNEESICSKTKRSEITKKKKKSIAEGNQDVDNIEYLQLGSILKDGDCESNCDEIRKTNAKKKKKKNTDKLLHSENEYSYNDDDDDDDDEYRKEQERLEKFRQLEYDTRLCDDEDDEFFDRTDESKKSNSSTKEKSVISCEKRNNSSYKRTGSSSCFMSTTSENEQTVKKKIKEFDGRYQDLKNRLQTLQSKYDNDNSNEVGDRKKNENDSDQDDQEEDPLDAYMRQTHLSLYREEKKKNRNANGIRFKSTASV